MSLIKRGWGIQREHGWKTFVIRIIRWIYLKQFRPNLPTVGYVEFNGVDTLPRKPLDKYLPDGWVITEDRPNYENGLINLHNNITDKGDDVVIIGGGYGASLVYAAQNVGRSGSVTLFEGSKKYFNHLNKLIKRNDLNGNCIVNHAIVGEDVHLFGEAESAKRIPVNELPDCDVLELDCEGGETDILGALEIRPKHLFIELHPHHGVTIERVIELLGRKNYEISGYYGHNGMSINQRQFQLLVTLDRDKESKYTDWGATHPPIIWASHTKSE